MALILMSKIGKNWTTIKRLQYNGRNIGVNELIVFFFKEWSIDWGAAMNCYLLDLL